MDILTHTISGMAVGTVVASFMPKGLIKKGFTIGICSVAGFLPDIDAISLWSRFDGSFGKLFNLSHSGKVIYSEKFWYSHHAFFHSFFASLFFASLLGITLYVISSKLKHVTIKNLLKSFPKNRLILIGFVTAFSLHLLEDMPTPSSAWGGVNFFWPSRSYIGGTGEIWWWNNYDIFLIALFVVVINVSLLVIGKILHKNIQKFTVLIFIIGFSLSVYEIKTRDYNFAYRGNTNRYIEFEEKSKELQKEILGDKLFFLMQKFDKKLKFYF